MTCNCDSQINPYPRCCKGQSASASLPKGTFQYCDACDPCNECVSTVRLCGFVVPSLEDGRYYKNSFIFDQETGATYYITEDRSEIPFGSIPFFVDDFDPETTSLSIAHNVVYDLSAGSVYVYGDDGEYMTIAMSGSTVTGIEAGTGITVTNSGTVYTVGIDADEIATADALETLETTVETNTTNIAANKTNIAANTSNISTLTDDVSSISTTLDTINSTASAASTDAASALAAASDAQDAAEAAQTSATTALTNANAAQTTANSALTLATTANTNASTAVTDLAALTTTVTDGLAEKVDIEATSSDTTTTITNAGAEISLVSSTNSVTSDIASGYGTLVYDDYPYVKLEANVDSAGIGTRIVAQKDTAWLNKNEAETYDSDHELLTAAEIQNLIDASAANIFIATYNTTTSTEIEAAYQASKAIFVYNAGVVFPLTNRASATNFSFGGTLETTNTTYTCDSDNWTTSTATLLSAEDTYPVGSVYMTTSSTTPTIGGFTWTSIGSATVGEKTVNYYERTA